MIPALLTPAALAVAAAAQPAPVSPALSAPAQALVQDATERLLAGESLPPGYLVQLQALPADQRLLVMVHLRRSGLLNDPALPADWVLAPPVQQPRP